MFYINLGGVNVCIVNSLLMNIIMHVYLVHMNMLIYYQLLNAEAPAFWPLDLRSRFDTQTSFQSSLRNDASPALPQRLLTFFPLRDLSKIHKNYLATRSILVYKIYLRWI